MAEAVLLALVSSTAILRGAAEIGENGGVGNRRRRFIRSAPCVAHRSSLRTFTAVIPANAGIQCARVVRRGIADWAAGRERRVCGEVGVLDSGFRRNDAADLRRRARRVMSSFLRKPE
jgi:hypothetical protein